MPLDARVKDALERSARIVAPDVRRNLSTVRQRKQRAMRRQRVGYALLVAAALVVVVVLGPRALDIIRSQREVPANPSSPSPTALVGSYRADLSGVGGPLVAASVDGVWSLTFDGDGSVVWNAPPDAGLSEFLPRDTYQLSGDRIATNLFSRDLCRGSGIGSYGWTRSGGALAFVVVRDDCPIRQAILTSLPWQPV